MLIDRHLISMVYQLEGRSTKQGLDSWTRGLVDPWTCGPVDCSFLNFTKIRKKHRKTGYGFDFRIMYMPHIATRKILTELRPRLLDVHRQYLCAELGLVC